MGCLRVIFFIVKANTRLPVINRLKTIVSSYAVVISHQTVIGHSFPGSPYIDSFLGSRQLVFNVNPFQFSCLWLSGKMIFPAFRTEIHPISAVKLFRELVCAGSGIHFVHIAYFPLGAEGSFNFFHLYTIILCVIVISHQFIYIFPSFTAVITHHVLVAKTCVKLYMFG